MIDDLPKGFQAGAAEACFRKAGRDDLGLIVSDRPCVLAAMFTKNLFRAAPVRVCQEILASGREVRAVVARISWHTRTGAARKRFLVNMAAKTQGRSDTMRPRSSRPALRKQASAAPALKPLGRSSIMVSPGRGRAPSQN